MPAATKGVELDALQTLRRERKKEKEGVVVVSRNQSQNKFSTFSIDKCFRYETIIKPTVSDQNEFSFLEVIKSL